MYLIYGGSAQVLWFVEAVGISPADDAGLSGSDSQRRQWRFFFACRWGGWFIAAGQSKPAVCSEVVLFQGPTSKSQVVDNKTHTSNQNFVIRFLQFKRALLMSLDQVGESQSRYSLQYWWSHSTEPCQIAQIDIGGIFQCLEWTGQDGKITGQRHLEEFTVAQVGGLLGDISTANSGHLSLYHPVFRYLPKTISHILIHHSATKSKCQCGAGVAANQQRQTGRNPLTQNYRKSSSTSHKFRVEWSGGVRNGWAQEPQQKVEQLARKYEDKYKQMGDVASKLTLDQATFRDIQEKKMELYSAIAKMEQGETSDTALQDRAEKIQTDLDELCKL
ncbi:hypothetical protein HPP92_022410 [Vanilla planifolia]|uniref:Uncharacterized protein n=1 Tax=Vanilla planifolia TaxID=51239 RepID=A0A835Q0I7_VANPL|nr:hypothetical protein HPP92_022410 [Vanilla planifolia]